MLHAVGFDMETPGRFELPDLPAGTIHVGLWRPGIYQPSVLVVEHRGPVTDVGAIRAEPTGSVRLDLTAAGGDLQELFVCLKFEHGNQIRIDASTSIEGAEIRDGAAWFPRVPPGKHRLLVGGGTLGQTVVPIQVFSGEEAQAEAMLVRGAPCRVSWPPDLEGRGFIAIRTENGDEVFREPARPAPGKGCSKTVYLAPGRYVAALERDGEALVEKLFRIDSAFAPGELEIALEP
jgi:hypothetical protein